MRGQILEFPIEMAGHLYNRAGATAQPVIKPEDAKERSLQKQWQHQQTHANSPSFCLNLHRKQHTIVTLTDNGYSINGHHSQFLRKSHDLTNYLVSHFIHNTTTHWHLWWYEINLLILHFSFIAISHILIHFLTPTHHFYPLLSISSILQAWNISFPQVVPIKDIIMQ